MYLLQIRVSLLEKLSPLFPWCTISVRGYFHLLKLNFRVPKSRTLLSLYSDSNP